MKFNKVKTIATVSMVVGAICAFNVIVFRLPLGIIEIIPAVFLEIPVIIGLHVLGVLTGVINLFLPFQGRAAVLSLEIATSIILLGTGLGLCHRRMFARNIGIVVAVIALIAESISLYVFPWSLSIELGFTRYGMQSWLLPIFAIVFSAWMLITLMRSKDYFSA